MSRIKSTEAIQDALTRGMVSATLDGMTAVAAGFTLFLYSPVLALVVVGALLIVLGLGFTFSPLTPAATEENIIAMATEQSHLIETMRAMPTIKLKGDENERKGKWRNRYAGVINSSVRMGRYEIMPEFPQNVVTGIQTVLVIYLGARVDPGCAGVLGRHAVRLPVLSPDLQRPRAIADGRDHAVPPASGTAGR